MRGCFTFASLVEGDCSLMCVISAGVGVRGPALQPAADSVSEPPGAVQYMYIHVARMSRCFQRL